MGMKVLAMTSPTDPKLHELLSIKLDVGDVSRRTSEKKKTTSSPRNLLHLLVVLLLPSQLMKHERARRLIHGMKVGMTLVVVSLLYILDVAHDRLGDNVMWAVMTVVVIFEVTSGATLGKGVNRGVGTISGGGLGFLVALLTQLAKGKWKAVVIAISLFIFGTGATYIRMIPSIKKRYDYGVLIFILTFSLVSVSGIRGDKIVKIATDRLSSIAMGFLICIFTSLLIFPIWAGDELHSSLISNFNNLATSLRDNMKHHFKLMDGKEEEEGSYNFKGCMVVLNSKALHENLANFAKWEPWHGRFGFNHPWSKYLEVGGHLRDLAVLILSLKICLQSEHRMSASASIREQCDEAGELISYTLQELGQSIRDMVAIDVQEQLLPRLQNMRQKLSSHISIDGNYCYEEGISMSYLVLMLDTIVGKVEVVARKIEELGKLARFRHL